jgi:hypothetical protein
MISATLNDKSLIVDILTQAYDTNDTINETVNEPASKRIRNTPEQETRRRCKINKLMAYGFDLCYQFGGAFLSDDKKSAVLVLFPDKKKMNFKVIWNEVKLVPIIGLLNIPRVLRREIEYNKILPDSPIIKGMFFGTYPQHANKGIGTVLLNELIAWSEEIGRPMYFEARIKHNELFYAKHGFETFHTLILGNRVWPCMKRIPSAK